MRRTTGWRQCLLLVAYAVPVNAWAAGSAGGAAQAPEVLIPGEAGSAPVLGVAASPIPGGLEGWQAVFRCPAGDDDRSCGVSVYGEEGSLVAEIAPLFPGAVCSGTATMAWSPGGGLAVAASCQGRGQREIRLAVIGNGGDVASDTRVGAATERGAARASAPLIVPGGPAGFWLFWLEGCPDRCQLTGSHHSWSRQALGDLLVLTPPGGAALQDRLAGVPAPDGGAVIAWERSAETGRRISLLRIERSGEIATRAELASEDPAASDRAPAVERTDGGFVIAWQRSWPRSNAGATVLVQRLGDDLSPAAPPVDLRRLRPDAHALGPVEIAARGEDLLVAWRELSERGAAADLVLGRLSSAGEWIGQPRRVATSLPREWPQLWLDGLAANRWALFWRQPDPSAEHPHPWLRRLVVPWRGPSWADGAPAPPEDEGQTGARL